MTEQRKTQPTQLGEGNTKPPPRSIRARRWCFTLNNYANTSITGIIEYFQDHKINYIIGREIGESGTPHLQGYIECKNAMDFKVLQKINPKIHWEKAKGNKEQNIEYCSKDGNFETNIPLPKREQIL
ncbi:hypothetical protein [Flavobacterium sp.]|uniref:hypothetical protein n=1 Tax=Flavobacterium sp. TaxID=239 RepID=UPI0040476FF9